MPHICIYIYIYLWPRPRLLPSKMATMAFFRGFIVKTGSPKFGLTRKPFLFNISCMLYNHILILDTTHSHTHGQGDSTYSTFQQKECDFSKNLILPGEMLNMLISGGPVE